MQLRREIRNSILRNALPLEGCRSCRKGLSRRCLLTGNARLRYRPFLHRPHRLAGNTVENIEKGFFARQSYRLHRLSIDADTNEVRSGRRIVIPQPMMCDLEVPYTLASLRLQADQTVPEQSIARTIDAVVIV